MNYRMLFYILGKIMKVEGVLLALPLLFAIVGGEQTVPAYVITILIVMIPGILLGIKPPQNRTIFAREGFLVVALSWITLSVTGALPFFFSGAIPSFADALFESISGFTTTGASILRDVEILPRSLLLWRSFTHWIGGMGVLVFVLAILPLAEGRSMLLMRAEMPGPMKGKLVSKLKNSAMILYGIYIAMTIVEFFLLLAGGMPAFDSLLNSFATAGTGGFAMRNASIAAYNSAYLETVITVFMLLFGINFNLFYLILTGNVLQALKSEELRWYLGIVAVSILIITVNIFSLYDNLVAALRYASFQVASIISTTGFVTANFDLWPDISRCVLFLLMFIGGCGGSTAGGLKITRIMILFKSAVREIRRMLHPRAVQAVKVDGKALSSEMVGGTAIYFFVYVAVGCLSILLISHDEFSLVTNFSAVFSCLSNVGPGFDAVGAVHNYADFSVASKSILMVDMLFGRLELFPMIMLVSPAAWRKN